VLVPAIALLPSLSYAAMIPVMVLIGIALNANVSVALVLAQEYLPAHMGLATGLTIGLCGGVGGLIVAALGLLGDAAGPSSVLYVIAALPLLVAMLSARLPRRPGPSGASAPSRTVRNRPDRLGHARAGPAREDGSVCLFAGASVPARLVGARQQPAEPVNSAERRTPTVQGSTRRHREAAIAAAALGLIILVAACGGSTGQGADTSPTPTAPTVSILITPKGGDNVKPQKHIVVKAIDGQLVEVSVDTKGEPVAGALDRSSTVWRSHGTLDTSMRYVVHATARDAAGRTVTTARTFHTLTPHSIISAQIFEGHGLSYGVGMPITLKFSRPVGDRAAVERALHVWSSRRVVGAWYWDGASTLYFRTRKYWPAHTKVRFVGDLNGVETSPGVYGTHTLKQSFVIGESLIAVADTRAHHIRIYRDRHIFAVWPMSSGRPDKETPNGTYLTIEKQNPAHMKGPGYDLQVPWSVRFTWSGDYVHDAYWSVGSQGFANVSHGCVNLSPANAETYYKMAVPGDPVTITGSPKAGKWDDGWTVWFLSWKQLLKGSALHKAVRAGPQGSTLVDPSTLRPSKAKSPLSGPKPGNSAAT
jgi:lipoprotein-anchoring transpeptidase ErfK/SrfK